MISGRLVVSATKPVATTNASVAAGEKSSRSRMATTIGVSSSAAPSLANTAAMPAPRRTISGKSSRPRPPPQRATWSAAHWKNPASSSSSEMTISPIKVKVASQTMCHTTGTSPRLITPVSRATTAPIVALQPMPRPRGCQMTNTSVTRKMATVSMAVPVGARIDRSVDLPVIQVIGGNGRVRRPCR